ncbi:KDO2-lipid IV(A) lauroyltransferase [Alteromonadaceae bacterium Bs31]|nr:KDO2-lipid IV(A) lauroyltransferase [Alteromonadaceae bacterium Bs31]
MASVGRLPLGLGRLLGAWIARLAWRFQPREAKVTQRNIDLCYPQLSQQQRYSLARASFIESGKLSIEINIVWHRSVQWVMDRIIAVHGSELLSKQHNAEQKQGLIVLGPHIGNWEVLGINISSFGPAAFLYQPPKQAYLEPLMLRSRARMGATLLATDVRGVAGLLRILKKGGTVGILPDQIPDEGGGEFADFFGQAAYTMTLVHRLVEKTQCRVVMGLCLRQQNGFEVVYREPPAEIYSSDKALALRALNQAVEEVVAYKPEQYQWEYKRFRKVPPGAQRHYRFNK